MSVELHDDEGNVLRQLGDVVDPLLDRELGATIAGGAQKVDVWIAFGLRKRWRVVSNGHTYGEWDELITAEMFISMLVDGNPDLERLC